MTKTPLLDPRVFGMLQHMLLRQHLPLVPPLISLLRLNHALDIGCGLHDWGKDVYRELLSQFDKSLVSEVNIDGIDHEKSTVELANRDIRTGRRNVVVYEADMYHLPSSMKGQYDLVQARFLAPWVAPHAWPSLLNQMAIACKRGGVVVWIEPALPTPSPGAPAWNQLLTWIELAIAHSQGSRGINAQKMETLFRQVGKWSQVQANSVPIPLRTVSRTAGCLTSEWAELFTRPLTALHPFLLAAGVASQQQVENGLKQVLDELIMRRVDSCWTWHSISGKKARGRSVLYLPAF